MNSKHAGLIILVKITCVLLIMALIPCLPNAWGYVEETTETDASPRESTPDVFEYERDGLSEIVWDSWFELSLDGRHIGWAHLSAARVMSSDVGELISVEFERCLTFQLREEEWIMGLSYEIVRDASGTPVSLEINITKGANAIQIIGEWTDGGLIISSSGNAGEGVFIDENVHLPFEMWGSEKWGEMIDGVEAEFRTFSMQSGELMNASAVVAGREPVDACGATTDAYRVDINFPSGEITEWRDDEGNLLGSLDNGMPGGLLFSLSGKDEALRPVEKFDLFELMRFGKTDVDLPEINIISEITYELTLTGGDIGEMVVEDERQVIEEEEGDAIRLRVVRIAPDADSAHPFPCVDESLAEYLTANKYLECGDKAIVRCARETIGDEGDAWQAAVLLEEWVCENLAKGGCPHFATAKETLDSMTGDCSEHAVLFAALLRAVGIPSKVVFGMVYHEGGFYCHMWTEAYIGDQWIAMDPIQGESCVDVGHIKLSESSLNDIESLASLMSSAEKIAGGLKVDIINYTQG